jgi:hypothetical protein
MAFIANRSKRYTGGARFGGHAGGFSGSYVSMSDTDPDLTPRRPGKHTTRRIFDLT